MTKRLLLFPLLLFMAGAILLSCVSYCFAADIQPPTDNEVNNWVNKDTLYVSGWGRDKQVKMYSIKNEWDQVKVEYWLYTVYTKTETNPDTDEVSYLAAYSLSIWVGVAGEPTKLENGGLGGTYRAADSTGAAISALDGVIVDSSKNLEPGWPVVSPDGKIVSAGSGGSPATGGGSSGSKIPGPSSWSQWLTGTVVAGIITAGIGLIGSLFGSAPPPGAPPTPPPDAPTLGPAKPYRETPDGSLNPPGMEPPPSLGPAKPYRETPDGSLNPPGPEPPPTLGPAKPYSEIPGGPLTYPRPVTQPSVEPGFLDYTVAAGETLVDTVVATGKGAYDFFTGLGKAIGTGYSEIGGLAVDLYNHGPVDTIKELWNSPGIIGEAIKHTIGEFIETINPTEEIKALNDPDMSLEGKAWAVSCIAIKVVNVILLKDSLKDLKNSLTRAPEEVVTKGTEALKTPVKPSGRTSSMSQSEAIAQAEKTVPKESTAAYEVVKGEAKKAVDDFTAKVDSGEPITTQDVLEVTKDPMVTREVLGKTNRPISSRVKNAVHEGRREIYKATDKQVAAELQKSPKYAKGKIKPKEVSTGGEADAVKSTDRDVQYVYEKKVRGADGKTRTVREDVPASEVKEIHDKAFADNTNFDPGPPPKDVDPKEWLNKQHADHAEKYGQNVIDRTSPEYIAEFSGAKGPSKITSDPQWKGHIYEKEKFGKLWDKPDKISKGEALEQLKKTGGEARKTAEGAGKTIDQQTQDALDIVERGGDPAVVDQAIKNLGITNGAEGLSNRLGSIIESGKWSPK